MSNEFLKIHATLPIVYIFRFIVLCILTSRKKIFFFQFVILVVDSTDRDRLSITKEELHKMMGHDELSKANILVFANKQDVKGCLSAAEISKLLNLQSIRSHGWHIQACCALTGEGYDNFLLSRLDNAPNYLVGCNIQKRY